MVTKKRGLGKSLDALLSASGRPNDLIENDESVDSDLVKEIPVGNIERGRYQPRKHLNQDALKDLAASIKQQGLMQPILVRPIGGEAGKPHYEIIAGERRWRACKSLGMEAVSAVVRDVPDEAAIAMAIIENLQREDLNPIEEAEALHRLQSEFNLTQSAVAEAVGKSRSTVANLLRLTSLQLGVKSLLETGKIEMGHARAILSLGPVDQQRAANEVLQKNLSVRQTERLARDLLKPVIHRKKESLKEDPDLARLKLQISEKLGAKVEITHASSGKGKLEISYNNLEELQGILSHLK
ncbi:MAG: ParB/RepB/Spo0J family partition protein [Halieaceae bacterium]|nr:ParB/RepB/Spo0J family partition protein [Halieaceae bacterium]